MAAGETVVHPADRATKGTAIRSRSFGQMPGLGLGLGFLVSFLVALTHRWGSLTLCFGVPAWEGIVVGVFCGLVLGGVAIARLAGKGGQRRDASSGGARPPRKRSALAGSRVAPLGGGLLAGIGLAISATQLASHAGAATLAGIPWEIGGMITGIGVALLLFEYGRRITAIAQREALSLVGSALVMTGALDLVARFASPSLAVALSAFELAGAAGVLIAVELTETGVSLSPAGKPGTTDPRPVPFSWRAVVRTSWKPAVGALICAFIMGFTWNTDLLGVQLNDVSVTTLEKTASFLLAGAVLLALARWSKKLGVQGALLGFVLPVMVVTFIVRPYFLDTQLGPVALAIIGVARETGFALFFSAAWLIVGLSAFEASGTGEARADAAGGARGQSILVAAIGVAGVLGFYALPALGTVSGYMGAILFTAYLVAIALISAFESRAVTSDAGAGLPSQQPETTPSEGYEALEQLLQARCDALARTYGLTPRESDIIVHLVRGHSYAYIAGALGVSENTVRTHVRNMYRKVGVNSREELLARIHEEG